MAASNYRPLSERLEKATPEQRKARELMRGGASPREIAKALAPAAAAEAAGGGPEDPAADLAAVKALKSAKKGAETARTAPKVQPRPLHRPTSRSRPPAPARAARATVRAIPSGPRLGAQATSGITKVIWAGAVFLIALEAMSYVTGQYFNWSLGGVTKALSLPKLPYVPLYTAPGSSSGGSGPAQGSSPTGSGAPNAPTNTGIPPDLIPGNTPRVGIPGVH